MARSLNKKYFGNRNIGTNGSSDDAIGGEGVGSVTIGTAGTYTSGLPTATFSAPDLPTGVTATGTVHGKVVSAATTANGTGYRAGDVLTVVGGTRATAGTITVASVLTVGTFGITNGGSLYDVTNGSEGDRITFTHANLSQALRVRVTAVSGSTVTAIAVEQPGVWVGTGAAPTSMANGVNGFTATTTARAGGDNNGNGLVLSFNANNWGVYAFGSVVEQGDYTVAASNPASFTGGSGTGAAATVTYGVKSVAITQKGSGYTSTGDAAVTFSSGTAAGTPVLTTDSGTLSPDSNNQGQNASNNQENAIVPYAKTTSGGTSKPADIIRQVGARRFKVKTADGTAICQLKGSAVSSVGEMTITATDSAGGTYFVTKIGGRKATLTRGTGTQFATDSAVQWTFGAPTLNTTVKIQNA